MNQRLVWNFEINNTPILNIQDLPQSEKESIKWEARYFWSQKEIICLKGLNDSFLDLGNYEIKHRNDQYLLLADDNYNLKKRRDELQYKPLLKEIDGIRGYGSKIDLCHNSAPEHLSLETIQKQALTIAVPKIALIYKFPTVPVVKLELARLTVAEKHFFTVCIEGRSQFLVNHIAKHLLPNQVSCDYVNFLKQIIKP
ncbi:hypothetical protein [Legionella hackeliae]|uniref:Uncharacterized protein n=1 Tax=Legionella hackeliae TaxID=449 RepID=A0A0A8UL04_LEGHA|nr:hypothetical protein [Legionella hackeliae]KTD13570.1 hypothetical protein Lhac_0954 [Legionella hackeliae]CEK09418.1 conserved protein of unknown function [Legionella hackeliae]STX49326.1 Uncharacterised protein [Legionella hackeliae]